MAVGIRCFDRATSCIRKKLALTSSTSGCRLVGIVHLRTKTTEVIRSAVPRNNFLKMFILLPLHVLAFVGHLQAEYTTISGSYFTYNASVVLYY
jgi:hypothetical protein